MMFNIETCQLQKDSNSYRLFLLWNVEAVLADLKDTPHTRFWATAEYLRWRYANRLLANMTNTAKKAPLISFLAEFRTSNSDAIERCRKVVEDPNLETPSPIHLNADVMDVYD